MKKNVSVPGFMTLITVFLIVSLVSLGGLACAAASGGSALADRSAEYLTEYRSAYALSERRLAEVDGCIAGAAESGLFDLNFEAMVSELGYAEYHIENGCYIVSCTTPVDTTTAVYWEISVPADVTTGGERYRVTARSTVSAEGSEAEESGGDEHINVWLG